MTSREQRIREVAHRLWEQEGRPHHQDRRHWELAERMIAEEEQGAGTRKSPPKARTSRPRRTTPAAAPKRKTSRA
jgi:hypothetical protein